MLDKSQNAFQTAQLLKDKYLSNRTHAAFKQLEEAATNNYWAKRWLADIYRDRQQPTFDGVINFLFRRGSNITAFDLYMDLTQPPKESLYSQSHPKDLNEVWNLKKEDLYAQFNAFRCERELRGYYKIDPPWYVRIFEEKERLDYDVRTSFSAFYLALSSDIDAKQGLSYLQTTTNLDSSSNIGKQAKFNAKVLLAFALKNQPVIQLLKRQSPKEFEKIIDIMLKPALNHVIRIANAQNDYRVLELIKEQNPARYDDAITAMLAQKDYASLVQTLKASHVPVIRQDQKIKSEEAAPSLYPKLEHHVQLAPEEKNPDDFFKDFSAMMQLLRMNDDSKVPAAANPFKYEPQPAEPTIGNKNLIELVELRPEKDANSVPAQDASPSQHLQQLADSNTDDRDLIKFEELSFPEVPVQEPPTSRIKLGIPN